MEKVKVYLLSRSFIIFLKGSFRKRSFSPLAHSPNDCVGQDWTRTKPGAGNPIRVSHMDGRGPLPLFSQARNLVKSWNSQVSTGTHMECWL